VETKDSTYLLLFLTVIAVLAGGYVLVKATISGTVSSYRLIVQALLILTSTIQLDLPLQLNFSISNSLLALSKLKVVCTEPFRMPFAGMVSVCCFDKTGTLTADKYVLQPPAPRNAEIKDTYTHDSAAFRCERSKWSVAANRLFVVHTDVLLATLSR
jgi:cation-transporting ATPase 13A1